MRSAARCLLATFDILEGSFYGNVNYMQNNWFNGGLGGAVWSLLECCVPFPVYVRAVNCNMTGPVVNMR